MKEEITIFALHLGVGGAEKYISSLCKMLKDNYKIKLISTYKLAEKPAFDFDGIDITYLINCGPKKEELKNAIKKLNIFDIVKYLFLNMKIYYLRYKRNKDIIKKVNSKFVVTTKFHNSLIGKYCNKDVIKISTEHNYHNNDKRYVNKIVKSLKNFDYLICVSEELKEYYESRLKNVKVRYIPNTLDEIRKIENKKYNNNIISVGRFSSEKGFLDLIDVFKIVNDEIKDSKLYLIGDGSLKNEIEDRVKKYNLEKNVIIPGFISDKDELNKYYDDSSVYVMTSFTESFGLVLIEAMSSKVPCIAFDCANGAKTLLKDNGILISNRDKEKMAKSIISLLKNKKTWEELSEKGYKFSKQFDIKEQKKQWLSLLKED